MKWIKNTRKKWRIWKEIMWKRAQTR